MKLVWHEFRTEARRLWPLALMFWLVVLADFGVSGNLWDEENVTPVIRSVRWILLVISALAVFAAVSPIRKGGGTIRFRPIPKGQLLLSRTLLLAVLIGFPWWIHEAVFLSRVARLSAFETGFGVFQRMVETGLLWLLAGMLGWVTGSVWRGLLAALAGFLIAILPLFAAFLFGEIFEFASAGQTEISPYTGGIFPGRTKLVTLLCVAALALSLWLGFRWRRRWGNGNRIVQWLPYGLLCGGMLFVVPPVTRFVDAFLLRAATSDAELAEVVRNLEIEPADSSELLKRTEDGSLEWRVEMRTAGLPEGYFAVPVLAGGVMRFRDRDVTVPFRKSPSDRFRDRSSAGPPPAMKILLDRFSELNGGEKSLACFQRASWTRFAMVPDTRDADSEALLLDPNEPRDAELTIWAEVWKVGEPEVLTFDQWSGGSGSSGNTIARWNHHQGPEVWIESFRPEFWLAFLGHKKRVRDTDRFHALWNEETGIFCEANHAHDFHVIGAESSCASLRLERTASLAGLPRYSPRRSEWFQWASDSKLVTIEAEFVGRVRRKLEPFEVELPKGFQRLSHSKTWTMDVVSGPEIAEKIGSLKKLPDSATDEEARLFFYRLLQLSETPTRDRRFHSPDVALLPSVNLLPNVTFMVDVGGIVEEVGDRHRPLTRKLAAENETVLGALAEDFWDDRDQDWILQNLPFSQKFQVLAGKKGWLRTEPAMIRKILEDGRLPISNSLLRAGLDLQLPAARRLATRWGFRTGNDIWPIDPEFEDEIRGELISKWRTGWEAERWKVGNFIVEPTIQDYWNAAVGLARFGDSGPLREVLEEFVKLRASVDGRVSYVFSRVAALNSALSGIEPLPNLDDPEFNDESIYRRAEEILAAEWAYDPKTLTWRVLAKP